MRVWFLLVLLAAVRALWSQPELLAALPPQPQLLLAFPRGAEPLTRLGAALQAAGWLREPLWQALARRPAWVRLRLAAEGLAAAAGAASVPALAKALCAEAALGLYAGRSGGPPALILATRVRDPDQARIFLDALHALTGTEPPEAWAPRAKHPEQRPLVRLAPGLHYTLRGDCLLLGTRPELLARCRRGPAGPPLVRRPEGVPADAPVWGTVGGAALRRTLLAAGRPRRLRPWWAAFLWGGLLARAAQAERLVFYLEAVPRGVRFIARASTQAPLPATHRGFVPVADGPIPVPPDLPGLIATAHLTRGWADLFAEREALVNLAGLKGLTRFVNGMNTLLADLDLVGDVLPLLAGPVTLVATVPAVKPTPALPSFGLVAALRRESDPSVRPRLVTAAQMAFGLMNFRAAQAGRPVYWLDLEHTARATLVLCRAEGTRPPGAVLPAVAVTAGHLVVATQPSLLRSLLERLEAMPPSSPWDLWVLHGAGLRAFLGARREELVAERMLRRDLTRARAAAEVDAFLKLLSRLERVRLAVGLPSGRLEIRLTLTVRSPGGK